MLPTCRFVVGSSRYVAGHPEDLARLHDRDAWEPASLAEARRALGAYVLREDCYGLRPVYEACVGMIPQWAAQGEFLSLVLDAIGSASTESPGPTARLVVLRRRPETGRKKELSQAGAPAARPAPPAQPAPRREEEKVATWFEVLVVDDVGEPVPGIELDFAVGRPSGRVATSGSGVARVENADVHSGSVRLADVPAASAVVEPRWASPRSGEMPGGDRVVQHELAGVPRNVRLESEIRHTIVLTRPPVKAEIRAVTYVGDHNLMKVNTSDWTDAGPAHPKPEWRKGDAQARPVSYTKGQTAVFDLELSATRDAGPAEDADLVGKASFGPMSFTGRGPVGRDAKPVPMKGAAVGDRVRALEGSIQFTATPARNGAGYGAGTSGGHKIYVTLDTPVTVAGSREAGITEKRMEAAVRLVGAAGTNDPHAIVSYLMRQFRFYTLRPDPAVPARYQHPAYFNEVGGAWPMAEYLGKSGECQAIVRFVRAAIKQVGCPGQADLVVCWADPDVGGGAKGLESTVPPGGGLSGKSKTVGGKIWYACLVDTYPDEGKIYDIEQLNAHYMGLNNFEACLRFEHGGTKRYYGGGAGSYQSSDEVLLAFYALAWVTFGHTAPTGSAGARVEKVVKRWRDASGKLL